MSRDPAEPADVVAWRIGVDLGRRGESVSSFLAQSAERITAAIAAEDVWSLEFLGQRSWARHVRDGHSLAGFLVGTRPRGIEPVSGDREEPSGRLYGSAGDGLRWLLRSDRPPHHPDFCELSCCWAKVPDPGPAVTVVPASLIPDGLVEIRGQVEGMEL